MAYNLNKYDNGGITSFTIADGTLNTSATSLKLPGINYSGYGLSMDQNMVDMTQNFARYTTPDNFMEGQLWYYTGIPLAPDTTPMTGNIHVCVANVSGTRSWAQVLTNRSTIVATQLANAVTFNDSGSGDASGVAFSGAAPSTVSYNTIGAAKGDSSGNFTGNTIGPIPAGNAFITGGTSGQFLTTNGSGNLAWSSVLPSPTTVTAITTGSATTPGTITGAWSLTAGSTLTATYADLAERFESDAPYDAGTVVELGGDHEITAVREELSDRVFGVVSSSAAFMMNGAAGNDRTHPAVAISGRVPVKVRGRVRKGDRLVSAGDGVARAADAKELTPFNTIGRSLVDKPTDDSGTVLAIVAIR